MSLVKSLPHLGDIVALPGFALLIWYFSQIPEKTDLEWLLLVFVTGAFIADILFTYLYIKVNGISRIK